MPTLTVETPERVSLTLDVAGPGSRLAAALFDGVRVALLVLLLWVLNALIVALNVVPGSWGGAIALACSFLLFWGYFALYEALADGRTPGKRRLGLRVVMDTGQAVTVSAALIRNLVRFVDMQPGLPLIGLASSWVHPAGKRLGDLAAGTLVVHDRSAGIELVVDSGDEEALTAPEPRLSEEEVEWLGRYLARATDLDAGTRRRLEQQMIARFADRYPEVRDAPAGRLNAVHARELAARRARSARGRRVASRFVAFRAGVWREFNESARAAERGGLSALSGDEVLRFAARYRAVSADLARARTYDVDPRTRAFLERLVAAGHHALYGIHGGRRPRPTSVLRELPRHVWSSRAYVLVACTLFVVPMVGSLVVMRQDPVLAYDVLPDAVLERAASGAAAIAADRGYAESPPTFLPMVASRIITNNVQVAIGAFAFGMTAGIGTVFVLVFNGVFFGSIVGHYANLGLAGWILTFVAGHGPLELTAIFIAGGAGLHLAHAIVAPGALPRRDALARHGREAAWLFAGAALLLLLAGLIEGFVSASGASMAYKLSVSGATVVLLVLLALAGRQSNHPAAEAVQRS